jgi:hypothetical protein
MAKLSEIISTIRNLPRGGQGDFDDNAYTDRQLAFVVNYYRAKLIRQDLNKGKYLTQYYNQVLGKVRIVKATKVECGGLDCEIDNVILRTEGVVPNTVDTNDKNVINYVGTIDGNTTWQRTTFQSSKYEQYSKYTGNRTKYYELNGYIYIVNPPSNTLKYITIVGTFEDPLKVNEFKKTACDDSTFCFDPFDMEYPLGIDQVDTIYKLIIATEFRFNHVLQYDTENNTKDDNQLATVTK